MTSFINKTIWIIGASSGIGEALAKHLATKNARVIISARREDKLQSICDNLDNRQNKHLCEAFDVTDLEAFKQAANKIQSEVKRIDSTILLAGTYDPKLIQDMDIDTSYNIIDVNIKGALNLSHIMIPFLKNQNGGQLAFTGSVAGYKGLPKGQPYSATKAAIMNFTESLYVEEPSIDVRLISPGFVETPMTDMNDFEMPMVIKPDDAAKALAEGLLSNSYEIHFPKKFTFIMKLLRLLPHWLYFKITKKMMKEIENRAVQSAK